LKSSKGDRRWIACTERWGGEEGVENFYQKTRSEYHIRNAGVKDDNIRALQMLNICSREVWSGFIWL
jgi:hypothetical protein